MFSFEEGNAGDSNMFLKNNALYTKHMCHNLHIPLWPPLQCIERTVSQEDNGMSCIFPQDTIFQYKCVSNVANILQVTAMI